MMPNEDGIQVCRELKADQSLPFMPVILVTAKADPGDIVAGLDAGGDEYVTKPVDHAALVARVRSILRIKALHDTVQEQAAQLEEWNRTLEQRVAAQLAEIACSRATVARSRWCSVICAGSPRSPRPASPRR